MVASHRAILFIFLALYSASGGIRAQNLLDPIPRPCRSLGDVSKPSDVAGNRNEYPAGGTLMVLAQVPAGVKGVFEFYLCLEDGNTPQEECLIRLPLQLRDGSGTRFDLSTVPKEGTFEIPVTIPDDISCEACTLQWRVILEECPDNTCQVLDEEFCADISVREVKGKSKRIFGMLFGLVKGIFSG